MNESSWLPNHIYNVENVIQTKSLGGIKIGSDESEIKVLLGTAELPAAKINRKSKIWVHLYGNVSLMVSDHKIICINIDFHGNRKEMVELDSMKNWNLKEWKEYAKKNDLSIDKILNNYRIKGDGISIGLDDDEKVSILSLE